MELNTSQRGRRALFVADDVTLTLNDHFTSRLSMRPEAELIAECAGRHKQRDSLADERRADLLRRLTVGSSP